MKYLVLFIKKIVLALCMLYTINVALFKANIYIPINYVSISFTTLFGFVGIVALLVIYKSI